MRQSSALFERLDRRFARMENLGKAPVRGYERLDKFIQSFQERMKRLESMGSFSEMGLFRRIPSFASNDPWGAMGGWSFAKDLVYLEGFPQEEELIEEAVAPRVSAWGTANGASGRKDLRVNSPWLNTPYTPARVSKGARVKGTASSARRAAPPRKSRKASPLESVLHKAAVSSFYQNTGKQVQESLPPMLSRSPKSVAKIANMERQSFSDSSILPSGRQLIMGSNRSSQSAKRIDGARASRPSRKSSSLGLTSLNNREREVGFFQQREVDSSQNRIQSDLPSVEDYQHFVQELQKKQASSTPISRQKKQHRLSTARRPSSGSSNFGRESILPSTSSRENSSDFSRRKEEIVSALSKQVQALGRSSGLTAEQKERAIQGLVSQADQKIQSLQFAPQYQKRGGLSTSLMGLVDATLERTRGEYQQEPSAFISGQIQPLSQTTETFSATKRSQIVELVERLEQMQGVNTGSVLPNVFRREKAVEQKIVTDLIVKIERLGRSSAESEDQIADRIQQHVQTAERKIRQLQTTRKMRNASPEFIDTTASFDFESTESSEQGLSSDRTSPWFSRKEETAGAREVSVGFPSKDVAEKLVAASRGRVEPAQISSLVDRLVQTQLQVERSRTISRMPKAVQQEIAIERTIVTDLVSAIEKLGRAANVSDEKLVENIEQHVQIAEQKLRKLSASRKNKTSMIEMSDIQSALPEEDVFSSEQNTAAVASPWFTRSPVSEEKTNLSPTQQAAARVMTENTRNPTRPAIIAKSFGLTKQRAEQVVAAIQSGQSLTEALGQTVKSDVRSKATSVDGARKERSQRRYTQPSLLDYVRKGRAQASSIQEDRFENITGRAEQVKAGASLQGVWDRATAPLHLPEWRSIGTESRNPLSSGRTWRLEPKRRAMYPSSALQETFLDPSSVSEEESGERTEATDRVSPWLSRQNMADFDSRMLKGSPDVSAMSRVRSKLGRSAGAKSVSLNIGEVQKQSATWLEPNRTVLLDNGVVIDAKQAASMGIKPKKNSVGNLPLEWTLEGLQLSSNNSALPGWAKRASGKPQYASKQRSVEQEFVSQVTNASSMEDVVEAILDRSKKEFSGNASLTKSTVQAIERIRKESHRALETKMVESVEKRMNAKQRRSSAHRSLSFTGLKPLAVGQTAQREQSPDKISRLAKQLENLVLLAEDNQRDEARQGVRMAEDSHAAVAEGQGMTGREDDRDASIDIEALAQEVLFAFEQELSLRKMRSFDESTNPDVWW